MQNDQKKKQRSRMNSARSSPGDPDNNGVGDLPEESKFGQGKASPSTGLIQNKKFTFGASGNESEEKEKSPTKSPDSPKKKNRKVSNSSGSQSPSKRRNRALSRSNLGAMYTTNSEKNIAV